MIPVNLIIGGLDIESTGLLTEDHRLVEVYIGLYRSSGKKIWEMNQRIDPKRSISVEAQRVHGISATDLFGQPEFVTVAPKILQALSKMHFVVAHNGDDFDLPFLAQEMKRVGLKMPKVLSVDTMQAGIWASADGKKPRLEELAYACGVPYDKSLAHAAEYDVSVMMQCFFKGLSWGFYEIPEAVLIALAA